MLADSLAAATGWLIFVALLAVGAVLPALLARLLRQGLPADDRRPSRLAPHAFGTSPRTRRSPRHAVELHRALITSSFASALGLVLLAFFAALRGMGVAELVLAVAFASPALLVALHARQRSRAR